MITFNEDFSAYAHDITRIHSRLSAKEERALGKRVRKGDEEAVNKLIEANLPLVVFYAKKFSAPSMSISDLIQEGNIGLMAAAKTFNYRRGCRFATHAVWYIKGRIRRSIENKSRLVKIPCNFYHLNKKNKEAAENGKPYIRVPSRITGYDPLNYEFKFVELGSINDLQTPDSKFISLMEDRDELEELMVDLTDSEKELICIYYGLYNTPRMDTIEVAAFLGISKSTVSNILNRALRKMWNEASETRQKQAIPKLGYLNRQRPPRKN